jgi:hypothetical protein
VTAETLTVPSLREVLLDGLNDAYWYRKGEVEMCACCTTHPAGVCTDHQEDNALARSYEDARKLIEQSPGHPEVLAVFAGLNGGTT